MTRRLLTSITAAALVLSAFGAGLLLVHNAFFGPTTITANFSSATGIYPGDEVRVAGVEPRPLREDVVRARCIVWSERERRERES